MPENKKISPSRRRFIGHTLKMAGFSVLLLPLQKAFGNSVSIINKIRTGKRKAFSLDKLVLNTKTNIVHLPSSKIFTNYDEIAGKNQRIINLATWETTVKPPVHFNKEKSGIILEILALQKLSAGINDKNITSTTNTITIAFTPVYKNPEGILINKYNFRLHELLLLLIALNNSISIAEKWTKFQAATSNLDYTTNEKGFPDYMNWIKTKSGFDKRILYISQHKTEYTTRLKERVENFKL